MRRILFTAAADTYVEVVTALREGIDPAAELAARGSVDDGLRILDKLDAAFARTKRAERHQFR